MSTGKAVAAAHLNNLNETRAWSWTTHNHLDQHIQQETHPRQTNNEQRFQAQTEVPEDQRSNQYDRRHQKWEIAKGTDQDHAGTEPGGFVLLKFPRDRYVYRDHGMNVDKPC